MGSKTDRDREEVERREDDSDLWEDFWTALISGLAEYQRTATSTSSPTTRLNIGVQDTPTSMLNTVIVPVSTIEVTTTIFSTTFVTIPSASISRTRSHPTGSAVSTTKVSTSSSASSRTLTNHMIGGSTTLKGAVPSTVVDSAQNDSPTYATSAAISAATDAVNATKSMIGTNTLHPARKRAIVGGLSGSIAGLLLIGALICLFLHRRRKKANSEEHGTSLSEKGMGIRPTLVRKWTDGLAAVTGKGSPKPTLSRPLSTVSVDEDHRIIRMSTRHWARPYAPGNGQGFRESLPPSHLRVVNPDPSRPATPARMSSDAASSLMRKQRSGLTGVVFGTSRPIDRRRSQQHPLSHSKIPPTIALVNPSPSREPITSYDVTPSFKSYPSVVSTPIVRPRAPEDPFLTPLQEESRQLGDSVPPSTQSGLKNPSLATLQSAKGVASRTLSHLGSHLLNPLRPKSSNTAVQDARRESHFSESSGATRISRRSDPFDLDAPSVIGSHASSNPRGAGDLRRQSANANCIMYEGT